MCHLHSLHPSLSVFPHSEFLGSFSTSYPFPGPICPLHRVPPSPTPSSCTRGSPPKPQNLEISAVSLHSLLQTPQNNPTTASPALPGLLPACYWVLPPSTTPWAGSTTSPCPPTSRFGPQNSEFRFVLLSTLSSPLQAVVDDFWGFYHVGCLAWKVPLPGLCLLVPETPLWSDPSLVDLFLHLCQLPCASVSLSSTVSADIATSTSRRALVCTLLARKSCLGRLESHLIWLCLCCSSPAFHHARLCCLPCSRPPLPHVLCHH